MPKRILFITDSVARQTGYATVIKNIIDNLDPGHTIAQLGLCHLPVQYGDTFPINYYTTIHDHSKCCGMGHVIEHYNKETKQVHYIAPDNRGTILPTQGICPHGTEIPGDGYGVQASFFAIQHFKPDIVIGINDVWAIYATNFLRNRQHFKFIPYLALDSECFPLTIDNKNGDVAVNTIEFLARSDQVIVFTEWAKRTINKTTQIGIGKIANNIDVIPHGVDRSQFYPLDNKDELREKYFNIKPDDNVFLIGSVARNQPRKRLDAVFQTLRILIDKYEKPGGKKFRVNFHCSIKDYLGWDLKWLSKYYGVEDRIVLNDQLKPGVGCPTPILNELINCYDAHLMLTNSEGWGLPILETMSCGIPNVISDFSAHGDWATPAALKVKIAATMHEVTTNHLKCIADVEHAAKQISLLYNSDKMHREYVRKSIKLAEALQWKNVCSNWNLLINAIDVSGFDPNRYDLHFISEKDIPELPENPTTTEFELPEA